LGQIPVSSNKSQLGHTLGAAAAIEAALSIEAMQMGMVLPTINHKPAPEFDDLDVVPDTFRAHPHDFLLSNAYGFGGTNCCIVFKGM
jgi:3-oxoacyl-[acyl-carrier-protein] synthase II